VIRSTPYGLVEELPCPVCGVGWSLGVDRESPETSRAFRDLVVACPDCRGLPDETTLSAHLVPEDFPMPLNRSQRRRRR